MLTTTKKESYNAVLKNVVSKGNYAIERKGQRVFIVCNKKKVIEYNQGVQIADFKKNKDIVKPLFKATRIGATNYLKKTNFNPPIIPNTHPPVFSNKDLWKSIPVNTEFYHLDAKHCYWRIAYVLGYIPKSVYLRYSGNTNLKLLRNISLAVFNSVNKREYYSNGEKINEIVCDTTLYKVLYNNIRHYAYNNSGQIQQAVPEYCIEYRVDGIFLLNPGLKKAKQIFKNNNLLFKEEKCIKIDEKYYSNQDGELKKIF